MKYLYKVVAGASLVLASVVVAQAPVEDLKVDSSVTNSASSTRANSNDTKATSSNGEMVLMLQQLQREVQMLRGMVEEQGYQLEQLRKQRLEDYMDLDRRIAALATGSTPVSMPQVATNDSAQGASAEATANGPEAEKAAYDAAYAKLRDRDFIGASQGFSQYLKQWPTGKYAPNCYYWDGEVALVQQDLERARQLFTQLVDQFPGSDKADDAKYKLGTIYHKLGDEENARKWLTEVARGDSRAARLASNYLRENLPR